MYKKTFYYITTLLFAARLCAMDLNQELLAAAKAGDTAKIQQLVDLRANVNTRGAFASTPLLLATISCRAQAVQKLLDARADVNAQSFAGLTALMTAAAHGNYKSVQALLTANANTELKDCNDKTALIYAALYRQTEVMRALLCAQADPNAMDINGNTVLLHAIPFNFPTQPEPTANLVRQLLVARADANFKHADNGAALIRAAAYCDSEVVEQLLHAKADVNTQDADGHTALYRATQAEACENIRLLLAARASINETRFNPLRWPAEHGNIDIITQLLSARANIDADSGCGTALMRAAKKGQTDAVQLLLKAHADPAIGRNSDGKTAYELATGDAIKKLIQDVLAEQDNKRLWMLSAIRSVEQGSLLALLSNELLFMLASMALPYSTCIPEFHR